MKRAEDCVMVKGRYDRQLYSIKFHDLQRISELIRLYQDSIYNLPDEEKIDAYPVFDDRPDTHRCELRVNEIVFV